MKLVEDNWELRICTCVVVRDSKPSINVLDTSAIWAGPEKITEEENKLKIFHKDIQ